MHVTTTTKPPDSERVPWDLLTLSPDKREAFSRDAEFRYGFHRLSSAGIDLNKLVRCYGVAVFKPEAFYSRKVEQGLQFLASKGYETVYAEIGEFTNSLIAQAWRYQLNPATPCRLDLLFRIGPRRPILTMLIRSTESELPATLLLSELKGSVKGRNPETLRGLLGGPTSFMNYVHVSDEPADVVRELPLWLSPEGYDSCLQCLSSDTATTVGVDRACIEEIYAGLEFSDMDPSATMGRLIGALRNGGAPEALLREMEAVRDGRRPLVARTLIESARTYAPSCSKWDVYLVTSHFAERTYRTIDQVVGKINAEAWRNYGQDCEPRERAVS
jgi:Nucleoside diphosphate kinase